MHRPSGGWPVHFKKGRTHCLLLKFASHKHSDDDWQSTNNTVVHEFISIIHISHLTMLRHIPQSREYKPHDDNSISPVFLYIHVCIAVTNTCRLSNSSKRRVYAAMPKSYLVYVTGRIQPCGVWATACCAIHLHPAANRLYAHTQSELYSDKLWQAVM